MKVVTLVTVVSRVKKGAKGDEFEDVFLPPGEVELDDETAKTLLERGQAKTIAAARAEAEEVADSVQVRATGNAPRIRSA